MQFNLAWGGVGATILQIVTQIVTQASHFLQEYGTYIWQRWQIFLPNGNLEISEVCASSVIINKLAVCFDSKEFRGTTSGLKQIFAYLDDETWVFKEIRKLRWKSKAQLQDKTRGNEAQEGM